LRASAVGRPPTLIWAIASFSRGVLRHDHGPRGLEHVERVRAGVEDLLDRRDERVVLGDAEVLRQAGRRAPGDRRDDGDEQRERGDRAAAKEAPAQGRAGGDQATAMSQPADPRIGGRRRDPRRQRGEGQIEALPARAGGAARPAGGEVGGSDRGLFAARLAVQLGGEERPGGGTAQRRGAGQGHRQEAESSHLAAAGEATLQVREDPGDLGRGCFRIVIGREQLERGVDRASHLIHLHL